MNSFFRIGKLVKKELLQAVRDRRTAMLVVIFPLFFYPLMLGTVYHFTTRGFSEAQTQPSAILYVGRGYSSQLVQRFTEAKNISPLFYSGLNRAQENFRAGQGDLLVAVGKKSGRGLDISLFYKRNSPQSELALNRAKTILQSYIEQRLKQSLQEIGLSYSEISPPFTIDVKSIGADQRNLGGQVLEQMLPYFIVLAIITAAMGYGAEITAGEKEKRTISTLLVSRLSRTQIVLGKFVAVWVVGFVAACLALFGLVYGLGIFGLGLNSGFLLQPLIVISLLATLLPLVALLSSVVIIVGSYARTQKEANLYQTPIYMVVILIGILSMSGAFNLSQLRFWLPVFNSLEVLKVLIEGQLQPFQLVQGFLTNLPLTILLVSVSVKLFNREEILFRA